jgi:hypothetical protein
MTAPVFQFNEFVSELTMQDAALKLVTHSNT